MGMRTVPTPISERFREASAAIILCVASDDFPRISIQDASDMEKGKGGQYWVVRSYDHCLPRSAPLTYPVRNRVWLVA